MKFLLAALLLLSSTVQAQTNHPYDPMLDGTSITYAVSTITGTYNDADMRITITSSNFVANQTISFSANQYDSYVTKDLYVRYYHSDTTPPLPINFNATVQDAKWAAYNNFQYIGEMVNELGNTIIPPEPKLEKFPVGGTTFSGASVIRKSPTDNTIINPSFQWKYRTIEHMAAPWGNFTDCWRTGLREYIPTAKDRVYNYLFMRNKGMVNFWYGDLNADGTVTGYQFFAIEY